MPRWALWVASVAAWSGCADPARFLLYPPELVDGTYASAMLFLQASQALEAEVLEAELLRLPPTVPRTFALEDAESARFRLFGYTADPEELGLTAGTLERAPPGEGLPLPEPDLAYASAGLEEGALTWIPEGPLNTTSFPWRQPGAAPGTECTDAHPQAWRIPGLELVQPRALLPIDEDQVIIAGQWSLPEGGASETLLTLVSDLDTSPHWELLAPPLPTQSYRDVTWIAERTILASTNRGWLTRVHLDSGVLDSRRVLPSSARWQLSRGDDGTVVAFDAQDDGEEAAARKDARLVDPETLAVSILDAPEPLRYVSVMTRDFMVAAGDRTLYRFESGSWIPEQSLEQPVTELAREGNRFIAVIGRRVALERDPSGQWRLLPSEINTFDLQVATFLPGGRFVTGGAAGFMLHHYGEQWCLIPRALSRAVRGIGPVDANTLLAVTYSETVGELVGITRVTFDP